MDVALPPVSDTVGEALHFLRIGRLWRGSSFIAGPFPCNPLSNCACGFPAHSLTMIFVMSLAPDSTPCLAADAGPSHRADRRSMPSALSPVAHRAETANAVCAGKQNYPAC